MVKQYQKYKKRSKFFSIIFRNLNILRKKSFLVGKKNFNAIIILLIAIITLSIIYYFINKSFLGEKNSIQEVLFDSGAIQTFDDPYFYKDIKSSLIGKNYVLVKYFQGGSIKNELKSKYSVLKDMSFKNIGNNGISVELSFNSPGVIINEGDRNIGVINGYFFDISSGSRFLSGITVINITGSTQGFKYLSGFFFKIDEKNLKFQIDEITKFFGNQYIKKIDYLPGGSKTIITLTDNKLIYINNLKNISEQLNKYYLVSKNYEKFNDAQELDLGSSDDVIVK